MRIRGIGLLTPTSFYRIQEVLIMGQKKLYRSLSNRMICGVCGGIGEYFNIDPTLIRLLWVLLSMGSCGTGLLIYIIAAVIIPENNGSNVI